VTSCSLVLNSDNVVEEEEEEEVTPLQDGPDYKAQMESRSINSNDRATPHAV
jgi:hypothetical protein